MTSDPLKIPIKRLRGDAVVPVKLSPGAAAFDLTAAIDKPIELRVGHKALVPTGLAFAIPDGYEGQIRPRSGLAAKEGIIILNSPGTLDSDYRGELKIILGRYGKAEPETMSDYAPFIIKPGDRIAQLVIAPVIACFFEELDELPSTARGKGGFGSTGVGSLDRSAK